MLNGSLYLTIPRGHNIAELLRHIYLIRMHPQVKRHFAALNVNETRLLRSAAVGFPTPTRPYMWMHLAGVDMSKVVDSPAAKDGKLNIIAVDVL